MAIFFSKLTKHPSIIYEHILKSCSIFIYFTQLSLISMRCFCLCTAVVAAIIFLLIDYLLECFFSSHFLFKQFLCASSLKLQLDT